MNPPAAAAAPLALGAPRADVAAYLHGGRAAHESLHRAAVDRFATAMLRKGLVLGTFTYTTCDEKQTCIRMCASAMANATKRAFRRWKRGGNGAWTPQCEVCHAMGIEVDDPKAAAADLESAHHEHFGRHATVVQLINALSTPACTVKFNGEGDPTIVSGMAVDLAELSRKFFEHHRAGPEGRKIFFLCKAHHRQYDYKGAPAAGHGRPT